MDAAGEPELQLQKLAPELITELRGSLPRFLWKSRRQDGKVIANVRRLVRQTKTDQLRKLLEPFQEWPQLLDPHLSGLLQPLVSAFIEYLFYHANAYYQRLDTEPSPDVIPMPRAICQILYLFCQIRGPKVIVRFLNNEPRVLEPMLDALECWANPQAFDSTLRDHPSIVWQERYIMLWWLSHLMLAPFDIVSMASENPGNGFDTHCLLIQFPDHTPPVARRISDISSHYLSSASKEREAASMLLARLALKPDMQLIGLQWSIFQSTFNVLEEGWGPLASPAPIHALLGLFSFITKFLTSADKNIARPLLSRIYRVIKQVRSPQSPHSTLVTSSTTARKFIIKISRIVAVARIKMAIERSNADANLEDDETLADLIDYLFVALEDRDTVVRVAASKAMSLVVVTLEPHMADQVISNLITDLGADLRLANDFHTQQSPDLFKLLQLSAGAGASIWDLLAYSNPDFSTVNAQKWHGLVLTLSQLMFRRASPSISQVIASLLPALHFEQRSSLGVSLGINVRDAACFGLWSVARRYSTDELQTVKTVIPHDLPSRHNCSLQTLANNLLVAATLDSAGNIRRGASAALQEMIGRHPDAVKHGISLVQVVDYHSIALRSKALLEVAILVSDLDVMYWDVILEGLLGWRGVGSSDAQSRRHAAKAISRLTLDATHKGPNTTTLTVVRDQLLATSSYEVEKRHGLFLALAYIVRAMSDSLSKNASLYKSQRTNLVGIWSVLFGTGAVSPTISESASFGIKSNATSSFDLILEGEFRLISAIAFASDSLIAELHHVFNIEVDTSATLHPIIDRINHGLSQTTATVIRAAVEAAVAVFRLLDFATQRPLVSQWAQILRSRNSNVGPTTPGVIDVLGAVCPVIEENKGGISSMSPNPDVVQWISSVEEPRIVTPHQQLIVNALLERLGDDRSTDIKCRVLGSLTCGIIASRLVTNDMIEAIHASLGDYTINEKGDVGSLVRIEAIGSVAMLLEKELLDEDEERKYIAKVCGLAAEKLDRVRLQAWVCLGAYFSKRSIHDFEGRRLEIGKWFSDVAQTASVEYFEQLMSLTSVDWIRKPLLKGYVTSAGVGSESLVRVTREAFESHARSLSDSRTRELCATVMDTFTDSFNDRTSRLLLPVMNFIAFLLGARIIEPRLDEQVFWIQFYNNLQRAHYKSTNTPLIEAALWIYSALAAFEPLKRLILKKLCRLLLHPYANVRKAAVESLFIAVGDENLLALDWSKSPKELESVAEELQKKLRV